MLITCRPPLLPDKGPRPSQLTSPPLQYSFSIPPCSSHTLLSTHQNHLLRTVRSERPLPLKASTTSPLSISRKMHTQLVYFALFAGLAGAAGLESKSIYAVEAIKSIMPGALADCSQFEFSKECRTPEEAAPHLINSLKGRTTGEIAMILSLIGVESGDLKFRINHFPSPGHPDQGTANMMSPMVSFALPKL